MEPSTAITQLAKMLTNLDRWLEKATAHAQARAFEVDVLAQARLAPDQFELVRQVQSACDAAKYAAAYLAGQPAPSHPDTERTVAELRARIRTCVDYLSSFDPAAFAGGGERRVTPAWLPQGWMRGDRYLAEVAIPNFHFHVVTAYAILRHNGVDLGKMDYIGSLPLEG